MGRRSIFLVFEGDEDYDADSEDLRWCKKSVYFTSSKLSLGKLEPRRSIISRLIIHTERTTSIGNEELNQSTGSILVDDLMNTSLKPFDVPSGLGFLSMMGSSMRNIFNSQRKL
mmetsp:Transcript_3229/g.4297  ORF Transcript_3229/g.4297 Transcript_3229/m.4297 type:complete len:114 (-) Transcript_3229:321-662(-)